jgi:hypothetical protein
MRRLLGLAVLFVVLCMSVPSYGQSDYFLVYNASYTVKGVNGGNDVKASIPWKAYYVVTLDSGDNLVDVNLIMYGKDSSKKNVYVNFGHNSTSPYKLGEYCPRQGDFVVIDIWPNNNIFDFEGLVVGMATPKDIGLGTTSKKQVASSMTGPMIVWHGMMFDPNDDIAGGGTISASLDLKTTKLVNANGWTQENIVEIGGTIAGKHQKSLIEILTSRHFNQATLP